MKLDHGGAPASGARWCVREGLHHGERGQDTADDCSLHPSSPPVGQPQVGHPLLRAGTNVLFDDRRDVAGRKGMQIQLGR